MIFLVPIHCLYLRGHWKRDSVNFGQLQNSQETPPPPIFSGHSQYPSLEAPENGGWKEGVVEGADRLVTMETGPVSLKISLAQWMEVESRTIQREPRTPAETEGLSGHTWERTVLKESQDPTKLQPESKTRAIRSDNTAPGVLPTPGVTERLCQSTGAGASAGVARCCPHVVNKGVATSVRAQDQLGWNSHLQIVN